MNILKLSVAILATTIASAAITPAFATDVQPYIGIRGGVSSHLYDDDDKGFSIDDETLGSINPFVGVHFGVNDFLGFSAEAEYFHHFKKSHKIKPEHCYYSYNCRESEVDISINGFYVNGYIHFWDKSAVSPFLGIGLGSSSIKMDPDDLQDNKSSGSFNFGGGVDFNIGDHFTFGLMARYTILSSDVSAVDYLGTIKVKF